jgi:hypothetical protein
MLPQLERDRYRIDGKFTPPCRLVSLPVKVTVVDATQGHRELVAHPPSQRTRPDKPEVMGI